MTQGIRGAESNDCQPGSPDHAAPSTSTRAGPCVTLPITRHPAGMQVVLGTTTPERVTAAAQGSDLALTRPEWYELFRAAGHRVP